MLLSVKSMLKEFILAIIIGGLLGLGVTGAYLSTHNKTNISNTTSAVISEPTLIPTTPQTNSTTPENKEAIIINSPTNNSLLSTSKTTITGTTTKNSNIIIATTSDTFTGKSDADGKFEIPISLETGLNIIKISSIDSEDNQEDTSINITYSTAKI